MTKILHDILDIDDIDDETANTSLQVVQSAGQDVIELDSILEDDSRNDIDLKRIENDFDEARDNIRGALETAKLASEYAFTIAKDKEDAKSFEALNSILKNIVDSSDKLISMYTRKEEFKEKKRKKGGEAESSIKIDKAIFTGSPKQLKQFIEQQKEDGD